MGLRQQRAGRFARTVLAPRQPVSRRRSAVLSQAVPGSAGADTRHLADLALVPAPMSARFALDVIILPSSEAGMARAPFSYAQLEQAFVQWARERADVRAAVVVGSRARRDHPADEWSDLDLIVYITDPQPYACDETWLDEIAEVWARTIDRTRGGDPEWLVLFADGVKGDFVLANGSAPLRAHLPFSPYKNVVRRGVRVL